MTLWLRSMICSTALAIPGLCQSSVGHSRYCKESDFRRRFWYTLPLTVLVTLIAMSGGAFDKLLRDARPWVEMLLATPVVLWSGGPFFVRWLQSIRLRSPNMWTLIGTGTGAAYLYSVVAVLAPDMFPPSFRAAGHVAVYFEAAAVIISLTLLGQVLELKARSETGAAIRALLGLAPKIAALALILSSVSVVGNALRLRQRKMSGGGEIASQEA